MADELKEFMGVVTEIRAEVEKGNKESGESKAALAKMEADLAKFAKQLDEIESKAGRPAEESKALAFEAEKKAFDQVLRRKGNYQISGNTTGGYMVPTLMANEFIRLIRDNDPVRQYARTISISGGSPLVVPRVTTNQTGGFTTETTSRSASSAAVMEQRTITPHPVYTQVLATYALIEDAAFPIVDLIMEQSAEALAYYEGYNFLNGNGSGVPYGIMNDTDVKANYITAGNDVLTADALVQLPTKIRASYQTGAIYMMKPATLAAALVLKEGSTTGGYYFHADPTADYKMKFNGWPVVLADSMPAIGDKTYPVVFGNFQRGYWIVDVANSMHIIVDPYTTKGYMTYHIEKRVGGNVVDPAAFAVIVTS